MSNKSICIAGKNSIAIAGLSYVIDKYSQTHKIFALGDKNDCEKDSWQPSYIKYAKENYIDVVELDKLYEIDNLCFISLEYFKLIDPLKFKSAKLFNIHFSLLPAYQGMYTSAHPILNNEKITGCTIHEIDAGIDTGPTISQIKFNIDIDNTCKDVYANYLKNGIELTFNTIDNLVSDSYQAQPQSKKGSSYYSKKSIDYSNISINFNQNAKDVSNQIKAFTFRDYQLPKFNKIDIFGYKITDTFSSKIPGSIIASKKNSYTVSTRDYDITIYFDNFDKFIESVKSNNLRSVMQAINLNPFIINEKNDKGWTALIIAAYNGYNNITDFLLKLNANPNLPNSKGTTPLMYAKDCCQNSGNTHGIQALINAGAKIEAKDIFRKSIYDYLNKDSIHYNKIVNLLDL
jgi:methionyl-tRNA formyltransferase